jgi:hypothetical protein
VPRQIADYKANIRSYLDRLGADIERRQQLVLRQCSITDPTEISARQLADLYASTEYDDPDTGRRCTGIGSQLLYDELSGYLHPQPGSGLLTLGTSRART